MTAAERGQHSAEAAPRARALLATCVAASVRAADEIRQRTPGRATLAWDMKGPTDFVSEVDRAAEGAIVTIVRERHPDAAVLAEEGSPEAAVTFQALPLRASSPLGLTKVASGIL